MATLKQIEGAVLRKLDNPKNFASNPGYISEAAIEVIDVKVTEANLSKEPWYLAKAPIYVNASQSEYPLDNVAPYFDKPRYLYTADESNVNFSRSMIKLVPQETLVGFYGGGDPVGAVPGYPHSALAASVYYDVARGNILEFAPIPNLSAQYTLVYETSIARPQSRDSVAFRFEQFNGYVAACTALQILPLCEWKGLDAAGNMAKQANIAGSIGRGYGLVVEVARGDKLYWQWRHTGKNASSEMSIGWGSGRI